ncbi:hypothetical protein K438DRAFT_1638576 [Mycena galopus ATCC 62051]|nr:hypothetical protein K438DRAFT_1638576 [Mycena galopus ATCC 62051]
MSSPFASKLGTNYCALDEEVLEIQSLLVEPLSRLQSLDNRIAELQKAIDELAEERTAVQAYVDAHKALISPIRRLPPEMLQEIFVACLPTHRNCAMSTMEAPILLGRICSSWRVISPRRSRAEAGTAGGDRRGLVKTVWPVPSVNITLQQ